MRIRSSLHTSGGVRRGSSSPLLCNGGLLRCLPINGPGPWSRMSRSLLSGYAFALLPALAVVRLSAAGNQIWRQLLLLGWWRELTVAASALGLAIFNARGMRDLCQEEIYFWTFLNLIFFAAALIMATRASRADAVAAEPEIVP